MWFKYVDIRKSNNKMVGKMNVPSHNTPKQYPLSHM
jgi:hypothetical protein